MSKTVLFQTIQFSVQKQFHFTQYKYSLILFDPWIGPYQVQPLRARVDHGAMAMKGPSALPKALRL